MDNLESQTYETFEKDAVKYIQVLLLSNFLLLFSNWIVICQIVHSSFHTRHNKLMIACLCLRHFLFSFIRALQSYNDMI